MKFTIKQASSGRWILYAKGIGQYGESYTTKEEAERALQHYS